MIAGIVGLRPDLEGRIRGVERRADLRHFTGDRRVVGADDVRLVANLQLPCFRRRDVHARDQLRQIHHRDDRATALRRLAGIERAVGDDAVDGADDPRVTQLRNGRIAPRLRLIALRRGVFERLLVSKAAEIVQALLCHFVLVLRLGEVHLRVVHVFLGDGALTKQPLTALVDRLGGIHRGFGGLHIELGLLGILGNRRACSGFVGRLGSRIRGFALAGGTRDIGVLELDE